MRVKELYPLTCCITLEASPIGDGSPEPTLLRTGSAVNFGIGSDFSVTDGTTGDANGTAASSSVAGILYKWTNYGKGWRSRWFTLRNDGVLSYSKPTRLHGASEDAVVIGSATANRLRKHKIGNPSNAGTVHLKISWFRESKSDERRFYIFTATKTLHLRTSSKKERSAWIQALVAIRGLFPLRQQNNNIPFLTRDLSISTERLKNRLLEGGIDEGLVKDCEQIMLSEFVGLQGQFQDLYKERSDLLDTLRQLEAANTEAEGSGINGEYRFPNLGRGKYIEFSTTESSDDIERQELEEASDNDEPQFFDAKEHFSGSTSPLDQMDKNINSTSEKQTNNYDHNVTNSRFLRVERRKKLPDPIEKEKGVSLWSMIKDNIGKDLTRVCLPVYFNEPISSLQKCFEDLEYSHLLDEAYEYGKAGNNLMRILKVAAFAVSGYASSEGRSCKPFNPLLGETYEADYPEKGVRFFSEKVSHHPTIIACHCEGKGWKFWCDTNIKSKFWGRSIQLDPVGTLHLEFDDGEIFQWSKVTTSIYNLILGNIYCDHHGTMHIQSNRSYSCKLKFKEQSLLDRNPHQVHGFIEDESERKVAQLFGKWDNSIYYIEGNGNPKDRSEASLLWKKNEPPLNPTRYNLTSFAITLNELTPELKETLPPTDSRLRPDQRHLENGEFDKANAEKLRLETRQRISRKLQENGWRPKWFEREGEGPFRYTGGYWEAREQRKWDGCPNIFGEIIEDVNAYCEDS